MPRTTPEIKVEAVAAMGAEVVLEGDSYSDAQAHCERLARGARAHASSTPSTTRS